MAWPNFNKVLGSKQKFSAVPSVAVSQRISSLNLLKQAQGNQCKHSPRLKINLIVVGRYICTKSFTFISYIVHHIPPHISTDPFKYSLFLLKSTQ